MLLKSSGPEMLEVSVSAELFSFVVAIERGTLASMLRAHVRRRRRSASSISVALDISVAPGAMLSIDFLRPTILWGPESGDPGPGGYLSLKRVASFLDLSAFTMRNGFFFLGSTWNHVCVDSRPRRRSSQKGFLFGKKKKNFARS